MNILSTLATALAILTTVATHASAQDPLLARDLVDSGSSGTGQLASAVTNISFSWVEEQDSGTTTFTLNTAPVVNGAEAWYVDTDLSDSLTIILDFESPVTQPLFFIDRMDDADLDFGVVPEAEAFIVEQTGGMVESGDDLFTAPSGLDAATGTIGLSGNYSRVIFTISSASGRDVFHIAAGAASELIDSPRFSELTRVQSHVSLGLTDLLVGSTTTVQRAEDLLSPSWTNIAQFVSSNGPTNVSDIVETDRAFYRFTRE